MECFVVYRNEIEGRIDPFYYRPEFRELIKKIKFKIKKLGDIGDVFDGPFGSNLKNNEYVNKGIPLLRVQNVKEGRLDLNNIVYISEEKHKLLKRSEVNEGNVIITKTGWLGNSAVIPKGITANIRADLAGVRIKSKNVDPNYLAIFINSPIGKKLCSRLNSGSTRERIVIENMRKLEIPIPPLEIQNRIVQLMDNAYNLKKSKEVEAKKLLDSINDYILSELGIKIPELKNQMAFVVYADDVKGERIDPYYYQPKFEEIEKAIKNGKYKLVKIKEVLEHIKKGIEVGSNAYVSEGIPFIRVADIDDYNIKLNDTDKKISYELYDKLKKDYQPKKEELLFSKDGTVGLCVIVNEEKDYIISGGILRLKTKKDINNYYLKSVLSNYLFKILFKHESIGAIIKHLRPEKFLNLEIPLPPLEIQNKIAEEVERRMRKAEQLQKEAKEILEKAKEEVENIILNGE